MRRNTTSAARQAPSTPHYENDFSPRFSTVSGAILMVTSLFICLVGRAGSLTSAAMRAADCESTPPMDFKQKVWSSTRLPLQWREKLDSRYTLARSKNLTRQLLMILPCCRMSWNTRQILGHVWISCPNCQSWLRSVFGRFWINWHVPFHTFHLSPKSLLQLLAEAGFAQIEVSQITPALWVAESFITFLFAKEGRKNCQLRNPFLTALLMLIARVVFFPVLWLGNRCGQGDCLLVVAAKA
jgi:hypothetical protein